MESLDSNANDFKGCLFMNKNEFDMKYSPTWTPRLLAEHNS